MIKKLSVSWAEFMVAHGAPEKQKAVYVYGLECILNELISDIFLLLLALFLGRVWEMAVWIVVFNMFRLNVGGYHASTSERCVLLSTALGVVCVFAYPLIKTGVLILVTMAICDIIIFLIAPVVNAKKRSVTEQRKRSAWVTSRVFAVLATILCIIFIRVSMENIAAMIAISVASVCFLALMAKTLQK